ncbi:RDD family protein [Pontibacter sp. JAM-7]|uniref:RDD family protein n=1 Tax=Pontibacter sp. JAM-7 TaxID=3366581 RepID=UPI003AF6F5EE
MNGLEYAGFWIRVGASLIDTLLMLIIILPLVSFIYGEAYWTSGQMLLGFWDALLNYILPAVVVILFWVYKAATPGKMALRLKIVDAQTGQAASKGQLIGRYFGYFVAILPLFLGIIWVGIDRKKQGWHDKLSGTVVVKNTEKARVVFQTEA